VKKKIVVFVVILMTTFFGSCSFFSTNNKNNSTKLINLNPDKNGEPWLAGGVKLPPEDEIEKIPMQGNSQINFLLVIRIILLMQGLGVMVHGFGMDGILLEKSASLHRMFMGELMEITNIKRTVVREILILPIG